MSARNWAVTCNSPNGPSYEAFNALRDNMIVQYFIGSHEVSASGTVHMQIYVQFNQRVTLVTVRRLLAGEFFPPGSSVFNPIYVESESDSETDEGQPFEHEIIQPFLNEGRMLA